MNGRKKPGTKNLCIVRSNKTTIFYYLSKAKGLVKDHPSFASAFCGINCSLAIKFNGNTHKYFNSESELRKLLVL